LDDVKGITKVPIAFFKGTADWMFSDQFLDQVSPPWPPQNSKSDEQLENDLRPRLEDKLLVKKFEGAPHGFAVRGDDMVQSEKDQKEEA
jgi:hypothetical protein